MWKGIKTWLSVAWDTLICSFWKWLVIMPLAALGTFQAVREEFLSEAQQEALRLFNVFPDWHWAIWICFALGVLVISVVHSAFLKYSKTVRAYEERLEIQKLELQAEYSKNLSSVTSIIAPTTPLAIGIEPVIHGLPLQSDGDLAITNANDHPIVCKAIGCLVAGSPSLVNGNRPYALKWQGTTLEEVHIPNCTQATLNVVSFGMPKLFSFLGIPFGLTWGLVFPTAGTHAPRGYFGEHQQLDMHYRRNKAIETSISLRVHLIAWPLGYPGNVTVIEKSYLAISGTQVKNLTFKEITDGDF